MSRTIPASFRSVACFAATLIALVLAQSVLFTELGHAALGTSGQWTPKENWANNDASRYAIHLILLPGDGSPYHSRILYWGHERGGFHGGEWGWTPGHDSCGVFPDSNFASIYVPPSGNDVFCAAHTLIGKSLVCPGGTDTVTGAYGVRMARILHDTTGTASPRWSDPGDMSAGSRWYPVATPLVDGYRVLVTTGDTHPEHLVLFGRRAGAAPSQPTGDSLYRFAPVNLGRWDVAVLPDTSASNPPRPEVREAHSAVQMAQVTGFEAQIYFGGKGANHYLNDVWFLRRDLNLLGSDFKYRWDKQSPGGNAPLARGEHTAIAAGNQMVVFGGRAGGDSVWSEVWRLYRNASDQLTWSNMQTSGLTLPARRGAASFYDVGKVNGTNVTRMIVFGGCGANDTPSDLNVWELRFDPGSPNLVTVDSLRLASAQATTPMPAPRRWHTLTYDARRRVRVDADTGRAAFMLGGERAGTAFGDTLWKLWIREDGKVLWEPQLTWNSSTAGAPTARYHHSAVFDPDQGAPDAKGRFYLFGGDSSAIALSSPGVFVLDPWKTSPSWTSWQAAGTAVAGHSALMDDHPNEVRMAEIYNADSLVWRAQPAATLFQPAYSPTFVVPGASAGSSRVVTFNLERTYWLDVPPANQQAGAWQQLTSGTTAYPPLAGIQYRPGKLMAAAGDSSKIPTGVTRTLDTSDLSHGWVTSHRLVPRANHNLVSLPNGTVLAVGGERSETDPEKRPQIWYPDSSSGGVAGVWSDPDELAVQGAARGYHSTAILLPDGRVLSSGSESADGVPLTHDKYQAEIFCPPYLFKASTGALATRPEFGCVPTTMTIGKVYTLPVSSTTNLTRVSLIRPGATTHSCRVRARRYHRALPSEPDGMVSHHPARAEAKGRRGDPSSHDEAEG